MTAEHQLTTYPSGLRVVTEPVPGVRSVALGMWIATGSASESDSQAGLSHLLEHMLFRGSERFEAIEIDQIFDAMGAELNAGTGKETTSLYTRVLDSNLERAFDVMSDMLWRARLSDIEAERQVVLEELAMYEDDPQDKVFDVLGEAIFGEHPLGRAIIGRADVVGGADQASLTAFHAARYIPANVVIAAAGSVDHEALLALVRESAPEAALGSGVPTAVPPPPPVARTRFVGKDTEQYHVCLGAPGIAQDDERRFALRVLDNVLGGTTSSRLFQEVRERRGLAYAVYSFAGLYAHTGQFGLYLGTRADNLAPALEAVAGELTRIVEEEIDAEELERAQENVKGRMVLALESTSARMNRLGSSILAGLPILTLDEAIERFDAVTLADVHDLATELLDPTRLCAAGIGPDEDVFCGALAPLGGSMSAQLQS
jgi:predicted Zn-dependent peptidase